MSGNKLKVGGVVLTDQIVNGVVIHKDFHSTPDLKKETEENGHLNCSVGGAGDHQIKPAISQDNFNNNCNNGIGSPPGVTGPCGVTADEVTMKMMTSSLDDRIGSQRGYFTLPR